MVHHPLLLNKNFLELFDSMEMTLMRCFVCDTEQRNAKRFIDLIHSKLFTFPTHRFKFLKTFIRAIFCAWPVEAETEDLLLDLLKKVKDEDYEKLVVELQSDQSLKFQIQTTRLSMKRDPKIEDFKHLIKEFERNVKISIFYRADYILSQNKISSLKKNFDS